MRGESEARADVGGTVCEVHLEHSVRKERGEAGNQQHPLLVNRDL